MSPPIPLKTPFPLEQGEHLAVIGDTGSGKSSLMARLLAGRDDVVAIRTKPDDVHYRGLTLIRKANGLDNIQHDKFLLFPRYERQSAETALLLDKVWRQGGWTVYLDELYYLDHELGLTLFINRLLTQGRSKGVSVWAAMQRPSLVTRFAMAESTHILCFGLEGRDIKTIGESTTKRLEQVVQSLERYQFAWFYRPERAIWIGRYQDLERG